jgi:hypothetical protein
MKSYLIEFITPLFSRGAYNEVPEIRPSSIRGQLHWWFRALGGDAGAEKEVFGGIHGGAAASRVLVRVADLPAAPSPPFFAATLPHKPRGQNAQSGPNAPKCAFPVGTRFTLIIGERLGGLQGSGKDLFNRTLNAWLLTGSLGLRTTRGGGSFHWAEAPIEPSAYLNAIDSTFRGSRLTFDLLDQLFPNAEAARRIVTETISHDAMADVYYPLGAVRQGQGDAAPARKTSPLRLTVRRFSDGFRILAIWDGREQVTGNTREHLKKAIQRLANGTEHSRPTQIGQLLNRSKFA